MTTPTPSAQVIEAMAEAITEHVFDLARASLHPEIAECVAVGAIKAASASRTS